ncbi:phospho-N-acetylmuramoyl-pentapeptide-transferase [Candidatus Saccharibacteria bacterium RIFCSPHIGHO2_12_FULL_47_16b]|nr:MAG: phospho-N-acetylmuramoyl-pentapeptide-transferase [Candidatus Saccharibacteria bacterium RIFCSPHIGHO2_12_FULL_47_16b]OGL39184.1 MAG: phospho-N-acetylmuramoyl-pentapeptide-transferase [Candidatus Saccharibacteria bacterium RIFCSPLOWO2_02_FULL_46_7]
MSTLQVIAEASVIEQIFMFGFLGFIISMILTPLYTTAAYSGKWWKRQRTTAITGEAATVYQKLHAQKHERNIPTMAGMIFVLATILVTMAGNLSRSQTWLPLAAMAGAGAIGLVDDLINIRGIGGTIAGMRAKVKAVLLTGVALVGGWWFYAKLDVTSVNIPFLGDLHIGWLIIPLFILVVFATANAVNFTDGLDGLAGGLAVIAFATYSLIAFIEGHYGVAGFCMTIAGALLAYTWFNVYPARFFMGDVGSFALGTALAVVAFLTDTVFLLPVIGLVFVVEIASVVIQIASKKLRNGKKVFLSSPLHHHFEALGWPETKVTMRFWIIGAVMSFLGLIMFILGGPGS